MILQSLSFCTSLTPVTEAIHSLLNLLIYVSWCPIPGFLFTSSSCCFRSEKDFWAQIQPLHRNIFTLTPLLTLTNSTGLAVSIYYLLTSLDHLGSVLTICAQQATFYSYILHPVLSLTSKVSFSHTMHSSNFLQNHNSRVELCRKRNDISHFFISMIKIQERKTERRQAY